MEIAKNKKGILLTLVTIVLLVLMLAELISYVYLNINLQNANSQITLSSSSYKFATTVSNSSAGFLRSSLGASLNLLASSSAPKKGGSLQINNTAYALESLMTNGTLYGANEISHLNGYTLINFTNTLIVQGRLENLNLTILNTMIQVYQTTPYNITATYTALYTINSSAAGGAITYPLNVTVQFPLNGTTDLYSVQNNNNYIIKFSSNYSSAQLVGNASNANTFKTKGSASPFLFAYGTVLYYNSLLGCSQIPSRFQNANYILAIPNAMPLVGSCGLGGLATYTLNSATTPNVPFLLYKSASNALNYINNGTSLLLNGHGYALYNITPLQNAVHSGQYYTSNFTPSYLGWAQNSQTQRSSGGIFSFDLYNRITPQSNPAKYSYLYANQIFSNTKSVSISLWFEPYVSSPAAEMGLAGENSSSANLAGLLMKGNSIIFGSDDSGCGYVNSSSINWTLKPNTWHNVVGVYNSSGESHIYLDGVLVGTNSITLCSVSNSRFTIGKGDRNDNYFNGTISNLQVYNISLSAAQASKLYYEGIEGEPVQNANLIGWWTLNGNLNDYSGNVNSATPTNSISYAYLHGYIGDPVYGGSFYPVGNSTTNLVEGVANCANVNQCSNASLQHFYLGEANISAITNIAISEANSFNLNNATVPNIAYLNGNGFIFAPINSLVSQNPNTWRTFAAYAWVYLDANTVGPVYDIIGCNAMGASCATAPLISVKGNTIYANSLDNSGAGLVYTAPKLNSWYNIITVYNNNADTLVLYVDGIKEGSATVTGYSIPANAYWTTNCGSGCILPSGVTSKFYGRMGDVQDIALPSAVTVGASQIYNWYLNDTAALPSSDSWPLNQPFNGLYNQTANLEVNQYTNQGYVADNQGICPNENMVLNECGVEYTQP